MLHNSICWRNPTSKQGPTPWRNSITSPQAVGTRLQEQIQQSHSWRRKWRQIAHHQLIKSQRDTGSYAKLFDKEHHERGKHPNKGKAESTLVCKISKIAFQKRTHTKGSPNCRDTLNLHRMIHLAMSYYYNCSNLWPSGKQIVLEDNQCVIENPIVAAQEASNGDNITSKSPLQELHEDLMEMITAL